MNELNKRVLHVDDDPYIQEYIFTILSDLVTITSAPTLEKARKYLKTRTYDVVLLDLTLPDGSGLELIQELTKDHPTTPIIIFSSHDIVTPPGNIVRSFDKGQVNDSALVHTIQSLVK